MGRDDRVLGTRKEALVDLSRLDGRLVGADDDSDGEGVDGFVELKRLVVRLDLGVAQPSAHVRVEGERLRGRARESIRVQGVGDDRRADLCLDEDAAVQGDRVGVKVAVDDALERFSRDRSAGGRLLVDEGSVRDHSGARVGMCARVSVSSGKSNRRSVAGLSGCASLSKPDLVHAGVLSVPPEAGVIDPGAVCQTSPCLGLALPERDARAPPTRAFPNASSPGSHLPPSQPLRHHDSYLRTTRRLHVFSHALVYAVKHRL